MSDEMLTCAKCGKKFLFKSEGLNRWAKNPNTDPKKVVCDECHSGKTSKAPAKTTAAKPCNTPIWLRVTLFIWLFMKNLKQRLQVSRLTQMSQLR